MSLEHFIKEQLVARRDSSSWRKRSIIDYSSGRYLTFDGRQYLNFSSNDYLGASQHPAIIAAWQRGAAEYGTGSGGSGHITGYTKAHHQLEAQLAEWLGYSNALLFISGFAANHAVITALMSKQDCIFADKLSHASIIDASIQSGARLRRFQHNDLSALQTLLTQAQKKSSVGNKLVVTEGVFSMDGDQAPLSDMHAMTQEAASWLMVDDAHGIGVRGKEGRGSCDELGIKPELLIVTFGKAFGLSGAAVLCDQDTADYLIQSARHLIYSTSMPPAQAMALQEAIRQIKQADEQRAQLAQNIQLFRHRLAALNLPLSPSLTAIQPVIVGSNECSLLLAEQLRKQHFWVQAIRPPTVPLGSARLRITLSALHTSEDIEQLTEVISDHLIN
nr:8-amino-7-oxononanoate synthase [uncultured Moellerella sp.]